MNRESPILFSGPMVRAILDGSKTQTRRVIRQGNPKTKRVYWASEEETVPQRGHYTGWVHECDAPLLLPLKCPYSVGDRLWVRETFSACREGAAHPKCVDYRADGTASPDTRWKPSLFMPRALSRITLEATEVRVQRVNEISDQDVRAEGVPRSEIDKWHKWLHPNDCAGHAFGQLWDSVNGKRPGCAWSDNPWVWCVSFRRVER